MQDLRQQLLKWVPDHEATLILFHFLRKKNPSLKNFADLQLFSGEIANDTKAAALLVAQERAAGIPLQHLLGTQFFLNHDYQVDASTLIPRPETEILATHIIEHARRRFQSTRSFRFAELGLGSGILSIELLSAFPGASGVASELSFTAIALAEKNLNSIIGNSWSSRFLILPAADPLQGFEALVSRGPFDVVFSNPPYVAITDEIEEQVLKHEPVTALYPLNRDPNFFYENFTRHAASLLTPSGVAFFEIPHERAHEILKHFQVSGFAESRLIDDLTGRPRVIEARRQK
jgi:release factor glutamine methyltransferase